MKLIDEYTEENDRNSRLDLIMNVLFKLHSRSIQMSKEILTLLRNGYPDGALTRWRSLHESNVIFKLLTLKNCTNFKSFFALKKLLNISNFFSYLFLLFLLLTNINPPTIFRIHVFIFTKPTVMESIKED